MNGLESSLEDVYNKIDTGREIIKKELKVPLHSKADIQSIELLRTQLAAIESTGIYIAEWKRTISELLPAVKDYYLSVVQKIDGYSKLNSTEKGIRLDALVGKINAYNIFLDELEQLIKRRCLMGQTFLNSISNENKVNSMNSANSINNELKFKGEKI